ncbi:MAG: hypothetical protein ABIG88_01720 [Patescibacteria group bacterium]|nr:hypothetical protein [Patescibacteria group bacterium]
MGHVTVIKRVPLDFVYSLGVVWEGYINPYLPQRCPVCEGTGYNLETKEVNDSFYSWCNDITQDEMQALMVAGRPNHFDIKSDTTVDEINKWHQQEVKFSTDYDVIDRSILVKARAKRLCVYGICVSCNKGCTNGDSQKAKKWQKQGPPIGEGYQLWEFVDGEGSPFTPVFTNTKMVIDWYFEKWGIKIDIPLD